MVHLQVNTEGIDTLKDIIKVCNNNLVNGYINYNHINNSIEWNNIINKNRK